MAIDVAFLLTAVAVEPIVVILSELELTKKISFQTDNTSVFVKVCVSIAMVCTGVVSFSMAAVALL